MLKFTDLSLRRGQRVLFEEVNLSIHAGWKVGITGRNGTGKSSLFALIKGELGSDVGHYTAPPDWVIAHVAQETPALSKSALDYVLDGDTELREIEAALEKAEAEDAGQRIAELHARLESIDGYTATTRAAILLHGLGFSDSQLSLPVASFSGGWRMRLNLAQALMCRSDLLLLDEPTNHLDLDAVYWLEEWLKRYPGTLLLISHDRDFLDRITDHIGHVEQQRIKLFTGNYSDFETRRAEQLAQQQMAFQRQQRQIDHIQKFVDRFRAKATKARQAQSRIKALERMQKIAPAHVDSQFSFEFYPPEKLGDPLLQIENARVGYDETVIIDEIKLSLSPGDRIGLIGPNGAGKSTLIKFLAGELAAQAGKRRECKDLLIGYFAQHQLEQLRASESPLQHLQRLDAEIFDDKATEAEHRKFLGRFGFHGDTALEIIGPLSGGEKARLVLALIVYQKPALLLLDEPTNHLDIDMRHALNMALQDFEGAMVIISHDRHLLRTATDRLLLVNQQHVSEYEGDLDEYKRFILQSTNAESSSTEANEPPKDTPVNRKEQRRLEAEARQQLQPIKNKIKKIETQMDQLNTEKSSLHDQLSQTEIYAEQNKAQLNALLIEQGKVNDALEDLEMDWLRLNDELESLQQAQQG